MPLTRRALLSTTAATAALAVAAPTATARPGSTGVRHIPLQGAVNVRDLGGYRTYDGDRFRHGRVFRADELGKLTDADVTTLAGLRLDRAIDFRVPFEIQQNGADRLPAGVTAVARPVSDLGLYAQLLQIIGSRDPVRQEAMLGGDRGAALMRTIYRAFVTDAANRGQFATTLRDLARARGPVLYHCTSGKDRTGWTSYLLLRLVGVPASVAEADYLLSNTYRAEADRRTREGVRALGLMQNPDLLIPVQEVRSDYLGAALDQAQTDFGGLTGYVRDGLGLKWGDIAALRARLVD
ncbi:tyrosine-protein phosphatase [Streptomyces sp. TRM66268-LWL]|uniref:Tyrosine-protein phosphatase n=1 Tax=Streptomyces polyasparticus TaxID=2767826 RepID=A0ABR7SC86_9ACTN|nr:tyrosine-protein phosphatase [Streptomyces polyasparticus]MBC9712106.1 tyrosine-protein phosphatase [Streptomyces polyasparticus]